MVRTLNKTTVLKGRSGKEYVFNLWSYDDFNDIKGSFTGGGLYLFTRRYWDGEKYMHSYIYLGETGDYYTRFNNHHKEQCIRLHQANCIGFYPMPGATEEQRQAAEEDLLAAYNFPCNTTDN